MMHTPALAGQSVRSHARPLLACLAGKAQAGHQSSLPQASTPQRDCQREPGIYTFILRIWQSACDSREQGHVVLTHDLLAGERQLKRAPLDNILACRLGHSLMPYV